MNLEQRLGRLDVLWRVAPKVVEQASWDLEWAVRWPDPKEPVERRFERIVAAHGLEESDLQRALVVALVRCGTPRGDAECIAELGVLPVLTMAAEERRSYEE